MKTMYDTLYLVWSDKLKTGIPIIDEQHRGLVSLINTFFFHKADVQAHPERFLVPTAEMLKAYTRLHFMTLERLMRETDYPEEKIKEETLAHKQTLSVIEAVDARCRANSDADGLLTFLKSYWQERQCKPNAGYIAHIKAYYSR